MTDSPNLDASQRLASWTAGAVAFLAPNILNFGAGLVMQIQAVRRPDPGYRIDPDFDRSTSIRYRVNGEDVAHVIGAGQWAALSEQLGERGLAIRTEDVNR